MSKRTANRTGDSPTVHLAASSGGHVELLHAIRGAFDGYRKVWVVQHSQRSEALAAAGESVSVLPAYDRNILRANPLSYFREAIRLVRRDRPSMVVTSGAGITVPFCLIARLSGAKVIFVETMARITGPSASGRVLSRLASVSLVQWPEVVNYYPRARLCRPALLEGLSASDARKRGHGTFIGVGTHDQQFNRLLAMVDRAIGRGILPTPVLAQGGHSNYCAENYEVRDWLTPEQVESGIAAAEYVVCHAGSGLVSTALRAGRRPLVLPRRASEDEHFDDHQLQIAAKFAELDLIVPLGDEIAEEELQGARAPLLNTRRDIDLPSITSVLSDELSRRALACTGTQGPTLS